MKYVSRVSLIALCAVSALGFIYVGCGSSSSTSSSSITTGPISGVASPATGSSARREAAGEQRFDLFGGSTGCGDGKSLTDQITEISQAADPANLAATATALANFHTPNSYRPSCFGPTWTDDAARSGRINRPSGDLGIVYADASNTDTTACVACELNALVSSGPGLGNRLIKVVSLGLAALANAGKSVPAEGASEDVLSIMPAVTGITFTAFTLARLADRGGNAMFKTTITFTAGGKSGSITLWHERIAADNSEHVGLLQAVLPHTPTMAGAGTHRGISFIYDLRGGVYKFRFATGANRTTASTDFFTGSNVDFSKASFGEDGHYILGYFDKKNNGGVLHYAWQAGEGDNATRAFSVHIPNGTVGSRTGTGWFGYGAEIQTLAGTGTPWMTKMHCNWLNSLGTGPSLTKAQKQTMTETATKFIAATSSIAFAPTDDCTDDSWTVSGAEASFLDGAKATAAHALVTPPTAADFTLYNFATAGNEPTFTIP